MAKNKKHTALNEKKGVINTSSISSASMEFIQKKRQEKLSATKLYEGILNGNISDLSRAITLVESTNETHKALADTILENCLPHSGNSIRIGITGVPGVGKSTFIEAFGNYLLHQGKKLAVLAIDPTSSITKGSILGDKTRMESLVKSDHAYIRPSASSGSLGGVARKTRESIVLCEAAGFDIIIVETVGVGQSETAVHDMVDFFLLLKLAGAGDELQGIKRGIIEMADAIIINKADGENIKSAELAKIEFSRALHLYPKKKSSWSPKVLLSSALHGTGIKPIWEMIQNYTKSTKANSFFDTNRKEQNVHWLIQTLTDQLYLNFYSNPSIKAELGNQKLLIEQQKITPFAAAEQLLKLYKSL